MDFKIESFFWVNTKDLECELTLTCNHDSVVLYCTFLRNYSGYKLLLESIRAQCNESNLMYFLDPKVLGLIAIEAENKFNEDSTLMMEYTFLEEEYYADKHNNGDHS